MVRIQDPAGSAWALTRSNDFLERARLCAKRAAKFRSEGRPFLADAQTERSVQLCSASLAMYPTNLSARCLMIGCLLQVGDYQDAKDNALVALRDCESMYAHLVDPALHLAVAHASVKLGHVKEASAALQDAVRDFPSHPGPAALLAKVLCSSGHCLAGKKAAALALERDSSLGFGECLTAAERADVRNVLQAPEVETNGTEDAPAGAPADGAASGPQRLRLGEALVISQDLQGSPAKDGSSGCEKSPEGSEWGVLEIGGAVASRGSSLGRPARRKPFGPLVAAAPVESSTQLREAALSDLERVLSNLMPSSTRLSFNELQGPDMSMSPGTCCSCRKQRVVDI